VFLKLYLRGLASALSEAAESDNPRFIDLALDLVERAALRFSGSGRLPPPQVLK
jgi:hypothetical protein